MPIFFWVLRISTRVLDGTHQFIVLFFLLLFLFVSYPSVYCIPGIRETIRMSSPSFLLTLHFVFQTMYDVLAFSMDFKWSQPSETVLFNKWHFSMPIVPNHAFLANLNLFNLYVFL